jgi:excinuclease ABC subunit A
VLVIEHHIDVIKQADHIIDLGPAGGDGGGEIVAEGTPEEVARTRRSATGKYLRPKLGMGANGRKKAAVPRKASKRAKARAK